MIPELSMIQALSVEGPALDIEPSAISTSSVEGSTPDTRTVLDSGPKHGRFGLGKWNHPRYRPPAWKVQLWTSNHPRYRPSAWKVQPWISNHPRYQPSAWMVQHMDPELSAILAFIADGPALGCRTFHDSGPKRGRFAPGY